MSVQLFGAVSVSVGARQLGPRDFGGLKPKQILEILILGRGGSVPKDRIADLLWGDDLPRNVAATIEQYVSQLRRNIDPEGGIGKRLIVTEREAYRIAPDLADVDLDRFKAWIDRARLAEGSVRRRYLEEALALSNGEVLEDEPYADWAQRVRDHYQGLVIEAAVGAAELAVVGGDFAGAHEHALRVLEFDPYSERCYRMAMLTLYAQGRRREALDMFDQCRHRLSEDLDTEPTPDTAALAAAVRSGTDLDLLLPKVDESGTEPPMDTGTTVRRPMRILLVEDNPADARMIREALRGSAPSIDLVVAADGEQALAMLNNEPPHTTMARPDLILLDLYLPKLEGTQVLAQVKSDPDLRRIPVVILTQSSAEQDILVCYDLGANGYITKPSDPTEFMAVVQSIESFWPSTAAIPPR